MHSQRKIRHRLILLWLLISACIECFSVSAYAGQKTPARSDAFAANSADRLQLKSSGMLAGVFNSDNCEEDDVGELTMPERIAPVSGMSGMQVANLYFVEKSPGDYSKKSSSKDSATLVDTVKQDTVAVAENKILAAKSIPEMRVPEATPPTSAVMISNTVWEIAVSDKTLNAAIARWTAQAGWQLLWELSVDYAVEARTIVPGTFEEAVETVTRSMETAEIPMKAIFYKGNKVLRIVQGGMK
ncbi:toxin co-regulated pilus biosynthesis Q family protein [Undibacterium sp. SXout7W]|uniref:toxin co-regulated pilus biosynthesis Q family protein n=1 Tax=Undibacterium sp. SXout7W TaxID=3413049 RepID=UPI003BEF7E73